MTESTEAGDSVAGEKLHAWGRKVSSVRLVPGTSAHRAQSVVIRGLPARCRIDKPWRIKR